MDMLLVIGGILLVIASIAMAFYAANFQVYAVAYKRFGYWTRDWLWALLTLELSKVGLLFVNLSVVLCAAAYLFPKFSSLADSMLIVVGVSGYGMMLIAIMNFGILKYRLKNSFPWYSFLVVFVHLQDLWDTYTLRAEILYKMRAGKDAELPYWVQLTVMTLALFCGIGGYEFAAAIRDKFLDDVNSAILKKIHTLSK